MNQISSPRYFSEDTLITYFSGKDTNDAIRLAQEWSERNNASLVSYYPQVAFGGKSILVGYKISI